MESREQASNDVDVGDTTDVCAGVVERIEAPVSTHKRKDRPPRDALGNALASFANFIGGAVSRELHRPQGSEYITYFPRSDVYVTFADYWEFVRLTRQRN